MGWDDSGTGAGPGSARSWCLAPVARTGVRAEGSSLVGEFTGPVPVAAASREQDCSSLTSKKSPPTNFLAGSFLRGFSCLLAQGLSPRLRGSVLGQNLLPQPAWVNLGQCLLSDPVLPAPTSILFAGPLGPEVGAGVGGAPKGKQLLPSLPASGDHHTPSLEACASASLPSFAPSPGMGVGQGQAKLTRVGRGERLFWPFFPLPHPPRYIAGWSLSLKSVELGVWFPFDFWILKLHSF